MNHKGAKRATKAERERMARIKAFDCVACTITRVFRTATGVEVHHLLSGNKRRGHLFTIPLCPWHHRGDAGGWGVKWMEANMGPSLARTSRKFRAVYGTDDELLERTNKLLENTP